MRNAFSLGLLALIMIASMSLVRGYTEVFPGDPLMAAQWKWDYALSHTQAELAAANVQITDDDINYARGRVKTSEDDCTERGGVWCDYANDDKAALQRLINVKAQQTGTQPEKVAGGNFFADLWGGVTGALGQLIAILAGWLGFD